MLLLNTPVYSISYIRTHPWLGAVFCSGRSGDLMVNSLSFSRGFYNKGVMACLTVYLLSSAALDALYYSCVSLTLLHKGMHQSP